MTQCCYNTHRGVDHQTFPKIDAVSNPNCCVGIQKEYPANIPMLGGSDPTASYTDAFLY